MKHTRLITKYLLGAGLQTGITCLVLFILKVYHINYPNVLNLLFLAVGGTATAIWGSMIALNSCKAQKLTDILKAFFNIKQPLKYYGLILIFLLILFAKQLSTGSIITGTKWYTFFLLFASALLFGGIEEIGWRYSFQPLVQEKLPYELATLITFISWSIWHYMYFYIVNTTNTIQHSSFLIGLLGSCFILAAIYTITKSLCLCVIYHSLLNTFSQTFIESSFQQTIITNVIVIILSIILVRFFPSASKVSRTSK